METGRRCVLPLFAAMLFGAGCSSLDGVPRAEMQPGKLYGRSMVFLEDGSRYEFQRVSFAADSLVGEYKVTVEREGAQAGAVSYEDELRAFRVPLARVDSVAVFRRDPMKTVFYGLGLAAAGYVVYELLDADALNERTGSGKPGGSPLR